jgi:hypothetical protein
VAVADVNGDGRGDIVAGTGPGAPPVVKIFSGADLSVLGQFNAFEPGFTGGVFVGAVVPEPFTGSVMAVGCALFLARRRVRR